MDDKSIVDLYWNRNEQAISETALKYGNYCYSIAYNILGTKEDSEEILNDTYNDTWNSIPPHKPSILPAFLGKITRRISIDRFRHKNAKKRGGGEIPMVLDELSWCISNGEDIDAELERNRLSEVINNFVVGLPELERKIFLCRYWYMDSIDTIGKTFGFSESKVKSMLFRLRERLRSLLIKEGFQ